MQWCPRLALAQLWREVMDLEAVRRLGRTLGVVLSDALAVGLYKGPCHSWARLYEWALGAKLHVSDQAVGLHVGHCHS